MIQIYKLSFLTTMIIITAAFGYSQTKIKCTENKIYETNCNKSIIIVQKDSLQKLGEYEASVQYNLEKLNDTAKLFETFYRLAVSYTKLNNQDSALYFLNQYIDISKDDRLIIVDKDFDDLRTDTTNWKQITEKIEKLYLLELEPSVDKDLALRLFYMGIEDQKYRVYLFALNQVPLDSTGCFTILASTKEIEELSKIIKQHGFPTISMVGKLGSLNAFLILQHSDKIVKYYRKVKKVYEQGEINSKEFAMLTDRRLMDLHRKQLYGTQLISNRRTNKIYPGKQILYPVKDFCNVNERRKEMGFNSTVEEYVASWQDSRYIIPEKYYKRNKKK